MANGRIVMDVTIPVLATIEFADGLGMSLNPIISITSRDLFTPDFPLISVDLGLE